MSFVKHISTNAGRRPSVFDRFRVLPLMLLLSGTCCHFCGSSVQAQDDMSALEHARSLSRAFRNASQRVTPSVVTVFSKVQRARVRSFGNRELYDESSAEVDAQLGSGVIIDRSGLLMTNYHVIEDADRILVRLSDGNEVEATDVRFDKPSDIAIMRLKSGSPYQSAKLGDSGELEIGDWVIAVGSPFELETTVSAGIISGKERVIEKIKRGKLLQTDAAINPGNSGGPLVNLEGEVIGINTAIASSSGGYQGIGFAIPIESAKWVVQQLLKHGRVERGFLGISIMNIDAKSASQLNRSVRSGIIVTHVTDDSPARNAGIQENDVITRFDGRPLHHFRDLQGMVERSTPGSRHTLDVVRNGRPMEIPVEIRPAR